MGIARGVKRDLLTIQEYLACIGRVDAAQDIDQSGFAGAVLPQQDMNLAGIDVEIHASQGLDAGKGFRDTAGFEEDVRHSGDGRSMGSEA